MIDKIISGIAFAALMVSGCALDSENMFLPIVIAIISGIVLLVEGMRYRKNVW